MTLLRIATRGSALAMAQTELIVGMLVKAHPLLAVEIISISTKGDQNLEEPLWKMEGVGFFTSHLEEALLDGVADIAVHSYKDLPTTPTPGLRVGAVPPRENPADCVVSRLKVGSMIRVSPGAFVGTSSLRRQAQLLQMRPDLTLKSIRGNVNTRLRKLDEGQYDMLVMAAAGLLRLGLGHRIGFTLEPEMFLPAPAQGAMAVQIRSDDTATAALVEAIDDKPARTVVEAERQVLRRLHPGCHAPVGVFGRRPGTELKLIAYASNPDGTESIRRETVGDAEQAETLADRLADDMIAAGAEALLEEDHE